MKALLLTKLSRQNWELARVTMTQISGSVHVGVDSNKNSH